jgi:hypothetical protein
MFKFLISSKLHQSTSVLIYCFSKTVECYIYVGGIHTVHLKLKTHNIHIVIINKLYYYYNYLLYNY